MTRFADKTAIVTGAASGIGAATARRLSGEGANVMLVDADAEGLNRVAADLPAERTRTLAGDISREDVNARMVADACDTFGGVNILVPNAGIAVKGTIGDLPTEDFRRVIETNLFGTHLAMKHAWSALRTRHGCVVVTDSVSGIRGDWGAFAYNTSKGAITNLVRATALDYRTHGVRVNAVAPGFTRTGMTADHVDDPDYLADMLPRIPMGRAGEAEEVAAAIAWLASDDASFVNGVILPVDGGTTASNGQPPLG
ncbi:SDR family NAD(P)-dependent oxidoreductase [Roseivivax marinus]|jgi:meso-butanediol dehydrogenase/(S,S)-butanediol dehydrogenase/diacetyl reductase|uniref:SDR family NAD(P)-dependent oxidoreductase n=1 Tax=Roseivivax marinus TaxID=1379903 RepID=UPI00273F653F|nr:glucose 1-dehydrogenase [Roseivivax marinus]